MRRGIKKKEGENLTDANIKKVIRLLTQENPITKREACDILNISYNTTRLSRIVEQYQADMEFRKTRMAQKRGRPATKDEIADIQQLDMWLDVNGVRRQTGNTRTMIFTCAQIVAHLSTLMTLHPGDVISTGTPPGVALGKGMDGDGYLEDGDVVEVWISGLGLQRQTVVADA